MKKKILFISARLPFPMVEGHQIRTFGVLSQLAKKNEIHLFSLLRKGEVIPQNNELTKICSSITGYTLNLGFYNNIRAIIESLLKSKSLMITRYISSKLKAIVSDKITELNPDIIHFDLLTLAGLFEIVPKNIPVILNEHNIESALIKQKSAGTSQALMKFILLRESKLLTKFEMASCQKAKAVLVCSDNDRLVVEGYGVKNVFTIPNGVDTKILVPDNSIQNDHFVFLGGMGWYPNKRGMEWFIDKVMTILYLSNPKIQIDVIGNPTPNLLIPEQFKNNINIHGFVDDFRPLVQNSLAMIVPLTVGSGTRLKILEGMALGKCIISTAIGAEGIPLKNNESILIENSANSFAQTMLSLLNNGEKALKIGQCARNIAVQNYDWNIIGKKLNKIYESVN